MEGNASRGIEANPQAFRWYSILLLNNDLTDDLFA
jgi:hypothetical protein